MGYNALLTTEVDVDSPGSAELFQKIKDCLDYLYSAIGSTEQAPINGSFEIDSDSDGIPDNWTQGLYAGGSGAYDTTTPFHGAKAYKFTRASGAGNGGGYMETGYIEISENISPVIEWAMKSSAAGLKNKVTVRYFDADKVDLSADEDIYTSTSNPTSWTKFIKWALPPANSRYMKVRFIGGYTDTDVAGDTYFDDVKIEPLPRTIHDVVSISSGISRASSYQNLNSATVRVPKGFSNMLIPITVVAKVPLSGGNSASGRYAIGGTYSSEVSANACEHNDGFNNGVTQIDISAISGSNTLYLQGLANPGTMYGYKNETFVTYIRK